MGVLYHRRDPVAHLRELRAQLRTGGELALETLYIEDGEEAVLAPGGRYAKMRNVWAIPRRDTLLGWLAEAGFDAARIVSTSITSTAEQRRTEWMRFESLADFLDPADPSRTIEGHPAPRRVIAIATAGA
jgi:tRNA (mo5U34)-methyltransferase